MSVRKALAGAVVALGISMGGSAFATTIVNLGFAIDHSGSMSESNFVLQKQGLANALNLIPKNDPNVQYNIAVVTFGSDVKTLVPPQIVTAANIGTIQTAITSHVRTNTGATYTGTAINTLTSLFPNASSALTLFNLSTDGSPNGGASPTSASAAAFAAGVDTISFEMVGSFGDSQINAMLALAGPDAVYITDAAALPDATKKGFVFGVEDFNDYQAAIGAKIQKIVDDTGGGGDVSAVPVPAALPMLLGAFGLLGGMRRRRRAA